MGKFGQELGDPASIAASIGEPAVSSVATKPFLMRLDDFLVTRQGQWWSIVAMTLGTALIPVVGWLGGAFLVWRSPLWSRMSTVVTVLIFPVSVAWIMIAPLGLNIYGLSLGFMSLIAFFYPLVTFVWLIATIRRDRVKRR